MLYLACLLLANIQAFLQTDVSNREVNGVTVMINWITVESSSIRKAGYNETNNELYVDLG